MNILQLETACIECGSVELDHDGFVINDDNSESPVYICLDCGCVFIEDEAEQLDTLPYFPPTSENDSSDWLKTFNYDEASEAAARKASADRAMTAPILGLEFRTNDAGQTEYRVIFGSHAHDDDASDTQPVPVLN